MTNLYAEWQKLRDNVQSASARLYSEKNENTERKYEEALERLAQFEKENGIPLMADEADVKKMFCLQTNEEWFDSLSTKEKAEWLDKVAEDCCQLCDEERREFCNKCIARDCEFENAKKWEMWLKQPHKE